MEDEEDGALQAWPLIIENASHMMKVGFASENAPRAVFPCMVGHLKHHITFCNFKDDCVGDEAYYKRGCLNLNYPIDRGIIKDWDGMIKIWHHIFHTELRVDPKEHPVLLTEPPLNPKANREKMTQIMFETFNVPALYIANKAVLSLFESGRMTGLVLDCGEHVSQAVPIYEGHALPHAVLRLDVGGRQIFESFNKKCCELHYGINCTIEKDMLKPVKENLMYVAYDYEQELVTALNSSCMEKWYMLPTGEHIIIRCQERFEQPEALFRPSLLEMDEPGIHEMVYNSIMKCDEDLRKEMYANIILCGGSSLFPGLQRRLIKEIEKLAPTGTTINVVAAPERKYSTWIGGSIVASLPIFQSWWITKEEYELYGASIVHRKCI